ncbi:MAG: hypothetical protein QNJ65_13225, partial [Xenococcaceae cyanobacterium MO_234.B1]|nr:hypothetical protein [Xenococcaceae cyanobacterium MO_234.B1]
LWGKEIGYQVERAGAELGSAPFESSVGLSGAFCLDKWRSSAKKAEVSSARERAPREGSNT